jgi:hypothetical protein
MKKVLNFGTFHVQVRFIRKSSVLFCTEIIDINSLHCKICGNIGNQSIAATCFVSESNFCGDLWA